MVSLYVLRHPVTQEIRYAGKANNSKKRLASHLRDSRRRNTPLYAWIRKLAQAGMIPTMEVVQEVADTEWRAAEAELIANLRVEYPRLLNLADGGDEPYCSSEVRAANGKMVSSARESDPRAKKIHAMKIVIGKALRNGWVRESTKDKLRECAARNPKLFGAWAAI